ncbi:hypothetical protein KIH31_02305 [Paenarthrobacter sp. DKR-5]|uniref:hypothetical protein n=1 Tax=Paenarthrobacter sp. DKR-5 TaxID=2835535 RepID=UPI001BDD0D73|nr:hypothetical protein [Paenarthrobacter sp. DKR-5]MBT1001424.1 hypothetical protein [Paenarthrobacter sp. DKR-5]
MQHQRSPFRLLRTAAVAVPMFLLAAGAHMLAGGALPALPVVAAMLALTAFPVIILTRAKLGPAVMVCLLGASQFALHAGLDRLSSARSFTPSAGGHLHTAMPVSGSMPGMDLASPGALEHPAAGSGFAMLALHAAATLITALLLTRGEAALWALAAWLRPLAQLFRALLVPGVPRPTATPGAGFTAQPWRSLRLPARRGPPAAVAV